MRAISAVESISLDGVMQAPGHPDEDPRGGFAHGGWAAPYGADPEQGRVMGEHMQGESDLLFGHRTYDGLRAAWSGRTDNPFSPRLDGGRKYVVSRTLDAAALPWANSVLLPDLDAVQVLRNGDGPDLTVLGSGQLVRALLAADLVDRLLLLVHPLVLGSGQRLLDGTGTRADLRLLSTTPTGAGVVINHYARR